MSQIVSWRLNKGMRSKYPSCYTAHGHTQLCHWKISTKFSWEGRNIRPRLSVRPAKYSRRAAFCQKFYFSASPTSIWFPGLMCFAISFAASSTCWHWKGDRPVPNTKSLFHCHIPSSAAFGKGVGSSRPSLASIQPSPVLASGPSWMSNVLWTEIDLS